MNMFDFKAEAASKKKQLEKLDKLIHAKKEKLSNKNFVRRAPEAVVQKERDRLMDLESQQRATKTAAEALAHMEKDLEELEKITSDIAAKKIKIAVLDFFLGETQSEGDTNGRHGM